MGAPNEKKFCCGCERDKPVNEFHKHRRTKDGLQSYCNPCRYDRNRARLKQARDENGLKVLDYLFAHPCTGCKEKDVLVLDFDHYLGRKTLGVSDMVNRGARWEKIAAEIAKCRVLCKNCHYRRTAVQLDHPRLRLLKLKDKLGVEGGLLVKL